MVHPNGRFQQFKNDTFADYGEHLYQNSEQALKYCQDKYPNSRFPENLGEIADIAYFDKNEVDKEHIVIK